MQRVVGGVVYSGCVVVEPGIVQVSDMLDFLIALTYRFPDRLERAHDAKPKKRFSD